MNVYRLEDLECIGFRLRAALERFPRVRPVYQGPKTQLREGSRLVPGLARTTGSVTEIDMQLSCG